MPAFGPCRRACGCAGLFFLPPDSAVLSVFAASLFAPSFFPSSVFLPVFRFSLAGPHLPLPASPSARFSLCPRLSQPASRQLCRAVLLRLYSVWFFFCHFLFFRSSSIARRLLSAACCPSLVAPSIVQRLPLVVRCPLSIPCRPLSIPCRPLSIPCRPLPVTCRPLFIACCVARTPSPLSVPRRRAAPLSAAVRSGSRLLYPRNPGLRVCGSCLPCRSAAGSVGRSFRKNAPPPPYLGRRAVSDKITPCILLSGAIFPARPAILLTIWQRLPFGTTFVQIQGVTGAPDPQGGRIPAARKENGKNINN